MAWEVKLVKKPVIFTWKSDYFPRTFHYKKYAVELQKTVAENGGKTEIEKVK